MKRGTLLYIRLQATGEHDRREGAESGSPCARSCSILPSPRRECRRSLRLTARPSLPLEYRQDKIPTDDDVKVFLVRTYMAISVSSTAGVPVVSCAAKNPMGRSTWSSSIQACACFSASARSLPRGSCTTMGTLAATFLFFSNEIDIAITTG